MCSGKPNSVFGYAALFVPQRPDGSTLLARTAGNQTATRATPIKIAGKPRVPRLHPLQDASDQPSQSESRGRGRPRPPRRQPQPLNDHHAPPAARSRSQREPDTDFLRPQRVPGTPRPKFASLRTQSARPACGVSNTACGLPNQRYCSLPRKVEHE